MIERTQNHTMQPILRALGGLLIGLLLGFPTAASASESDAFASVLGARMLRRLDQYRAPGAVVASISDGGVARVCYRGTVIASSGWDDAASGHA